MTSNERQHWIDRINLVESGLALLASPSPQKDKDIFPLLDLEEWFCNHPQHGKIMASLVDLKLTWFFTDSDFVSACLVYQDKLHFRRLPSYTYNEIAASRISFLNHANSFVLRCRAFWDKLMGLLLLIFASDYPNSGSGKRSPRKRFLKRAPNFLEHESVDSIASLLTLLNDHRTPEAHADGSMREWVLQPWDENPINTKYADLVTIRNKSCDYTADIIKLIRERPYPFETHNTPLPLK